MANGRQYICCACSDKSRRSSLSVALQAVGGCPVPARAFGEDREHGSRPRPVPKAPAWTLCISGISGDLEQAQAPSGKKQRASLLAPSARCKLAMWATTGKDRTCFSAGLQGSRRVAFGLGYKEHKPLMAAASDSLEFWI